MSTRKVRYSLRPGASMTTIENGRERSRDVKLGDSFETSNITDKSWGELLEMRQAWINGEARRMTIFGVNRTFVFDLADVVSFDFWPGSEEPR